MQQKKSSFKIRRSMNFPMVAIVNEFRSELLVAFPDLAAIAQPGFSVGYVLEGNKSFSYLLTTTWNWSLASCHTCKYAVFFILIES